jgi:hypothetical protein
MKELKNLKGVNDVDPSHNRTSSGQSDSNMTDSTTGYSVDHCGYAEELDIKQRYDLQEALKAKKALEEANLKAQNATK